jgi:hypothetical protein
MFGGASAIEALYFTLDIDKGRPSPYDYIQLPSWFVKFSPGLGGCYIHDEILLAMRQDPLSKVALQVIENEGSWIT